MPRGKDSFLDLWLFFGFRDGCFPKFRFARFVSTSFGALMRVRHVGGFESRHGIDAKLFQWTVLRCRLHLHECVSQTFFDFVAIVLKEQAAAKKDEERMLWSSLSQVQIYPIPTVPTMGHETRALTQDLYGPSLLTLFSSLSSC